jgi:hypothetical protein
VKPRRVLATLPGRDGNELKLLTLEAGSHVAESIMAYCALLLAVWPVAACLITVIRYAKYQLVPSLCPRSSTGFLLIFAIVVILVCRVWGQARTPVCARQRAQAACMALFCLSRDPFQARFILALRAPLRMVGRCPLVLPVAFVSWWLIAMFVVSLAA